MSIKERIKSIKWDEGASELLEFCVMAPFVLWLTLCFLDMALYVRSGQVAEHLTYVGGRAAVVCNQDTASDTDQRIDNATDTANEIVLNSMLGSGYQRTTSGTPGKKEWCGKIALVDSTAEWGKGSLMTYTITMGVPQFLGEFKKVSASITLMIETPVIGTSIEN